jgi:tetratricopeptide (TPR) repeat protein
VRVALGVAAVIAVATVSPRTRADETPAKEDARRPAKEAREEARARFNRGVELFEEQEYERALVEFERAHALAPSVGVLYNLAQVNAQLHRYAKAVPLYERYLAEGGTDLPEARVAEVERELAEARQRTAKLLVRVDQASAEITLDDQPFATSPMTKAVLVDSGQHRVTAGKRGFRTMNRTLALAGGDDATVDIALEPEARERTVVIEKTSRAPLWIAWGAAGALAIGTTVFAISALDAGSDLDDLKAKEGSAATERSSAASRIKTFSVLADAFGAATLVTAGVALYLTLHKASGPSAVAAARLEVSPGSFRLTGSF